ncbi:MAG: ArsA family ATPase, partial [Acidimicrobiales bacterium]
GMEEGFRGRAARVTELLASDAAAFVLVASPRSDTVAEALFFADKLADAEIKVQGLVVNRLHPRFEEPPRALPPPSSGPLAVFEANLADFTAVAAREESNLAVLAERVAPAPLARVPFLAGDVHDLEGLGEVAGHLFGPG